MTTAQEILRLIETVSPGDTAKLDEIDALVSCWLHNRNFYMWNDKERTVFSTWARDEVGNNVPESCCNHSDWWKYTRSRDALKAIRPKGLRIDIWAFTDGSFRCLVDQLGADDGLFDSIHLPTEELAELHAIISAIQWERAQTVSKEV